MFRCYFYGIGILFGLLLASFSGNAVSEKVEKLQTVTDLESLGEQANEKSLVILIMFSAEDCPFCELMEHSYLLPLQRNKAAREKVIIRKVMIDSYGSLKDFGGKRISAEDFPAKYGASVTPTLVFLNGDGQQVAEKLIGVGTEGLFAEEIEKAIEKGILQLDW